MAARAGVSCAPAFRAVTVEAIEDFFIAYGRDHGQASCRSMQTSMRLFLRYAMERGWVGEEMLEAVPSLRSYRLSQVPRGLSDEQLLRLLESPFEHGQCPLRDWAIVCLLATIEFAAHKGGKAIRQWLTDAIAEGLARYLRDERPESSRAFVFLRHRRPYGQLSPSAITERVRSRMVRRGLPPLGPHSLRHTFASRMLRAGRSVKAIADLLGHRSLASVDVYAKVDSARLLEVAVEWPEVGP
jgi:integrase